MCVVCSVYLFYSVGRQHWQLEEVLVTLAREWFSSVLTGGASQVRIQPSGVENTKENNLVCCINVLKTDVWKVDCHLNCAFCMVGFNRIIPENSLSLEQLHAKVSPLDWSRGSPLTEHPKQTSADTSTGITRIEPPTGQWVFNRTINFKC